MGKFIIIFDGYDEIALDNQDFVTNSLLEFVSKARNNYFILTSRPEPALAAFGSFKMFKIKPLQSTQYNSIIRKCDSVTGLGLSEDLIKEIRERGSDIIAFLSNPFLVTLLYNCYFYNRNIPVRKMQFYDEIYTALFKHHDLSKDKFERLKRSGLDIYNFKLVLRKFAFDSARTGDTDFSETSLVEAIKKAKESLVGIPSFDPVHFAEDVIKRVPLLVKEGLHIKWSHKSLQDYFAAEYVYSSEKKSNLVNSILKSNNFFKYYNIIDFIVEMDYNLIRNGFLYDILKKFISYTDEMKKQLPLLDFQEIKIRAGLFFERKMKVFNSEIFSKEIESASYRSLSFLEPEDDLILAYEEEETFSVLGIIERKKMEDLFLSKNTIRKKHKGKISEFFSVKDGPIQLDDTEARCYKSPEDFCIVNSILGHNRHRAILDYDKALRVIENIELQRSKQAYEDSIAF